MLSSKSHSIHICPLCKSSHTRLLDVTFKERLYFKCDHCDFISVNKESLPNPEIEKNRYLQHINTPEDESYMHFLNQVTRPLIPLLSSSSSGLDYGCGPSPVLAQHIQHIGYHCDKYDPFFFPDRPEGKYDFITATECLEHFHQPSKDLEYLVSLLHPDGLLAIMTETWFSIDALKDWYYIRDITHVCFYHERTMHWIAQHYGLSLIHSDEKRVFIFRKDGKLSLPPKDV